MTTAMAPLADTSPVIAAALQRSTWAQGAEYVAPADVTPEMLPIGVVMAQTGLTVTTINAAVAHPADHENRRAPLRTIAHPRWNVGGVPHWSTDQVASFHAVTASLHGVDKAWAHLPFIGEDDAVRAQLASLTGMSDRGPRLGKTNFHRWKLRASFPEPVARIDRNGPSSMLVYPWIKSDHLRGVLIDGSMELFGAVDELWLDTAINQLTVSGWLREHNPSWVQRHPNRDLTVKITQP